MPLPGVSHFLAEWKCIGSIEQAQLEAQWIAFPVVPMYSEFRVSCRFEDDAHRGDPIPRTAIYGDLPHAGGVHYTIEIKKKLTYFWTI